MDFNQAAKDYRQSASNQFCYKYGVDSLEGLLRKAYEEGLADERAKYTPLKGVPEKELARGYSVLAASLERIADAIEARIPYPLNSSYVPVAQPYTPVPNLPFRGTAVCANSGSAPSIDTIPF